MRMGVCVVRVNGEWAGAGSVGYYWSLGKRSVRWEDYLSVWVWIFIHVVKVYVDSHHVHIDSAADE